MKLLSCSFNLDTACVEILFDDGSSLMIDCPVIENQYGTTLRRRSELDWLIEALSNASDHVRSSAIDILRSYLRST